MAETATDKELEIVVPAGTALQCFTAQDENGNPTGLEHLIQKAWDFAATVIPTADVSTKEGRAAIASNAFKIAKAKTKLEAEGKALADEQKKVPAKIDKARRYAKETLEALQTEVRKPLTDWEVAEEKRVDYHKAVIAAIKWRETITWQANDIGNLRGALAVTEAQVIGLDCEEFVSEYAQAKDGAIRHLTAQIEAREKYDADQAELARLREAESVRAAEAERERLRKEGEDRARKAEEDRKAKEDADRIAAEQKAEADRQAEAQRVKDAAETRQREFERRHQEQQRQIDEANAKAAKAEQDARDRLAAEKLAEEQEAERRAENRRIVGAINRTVVGDLVAKCGVDEETARKIVTAIAKQEIRHTRIIY